MIALHAGVFLGLGAMPLISCPECGQQVSTAAHACPSCGFPVAEQLTAQGPPAAPTDTVPKSPLAEVRPSWWRFFWHLFFFWLVVPPIIAWIRRASVVLRVYPGRITLERGVFSQFYRRLL